MSDVIVYDVMPNIVYIMVAIRASRIFMVMANSMQKIALHIGCGYIKFKSTEEIKWINIDIAPEVKPDLIADMRKLPYADNSIDEIYTSHTLEHTDFVEAMREMYRILKPGGILKIVVPYAACMGSHVPMHKTLFSWNSFTPFIVGKDGDYYVNFHFSKKYQELRFFFWNRIIKKMAHRHPMLYENSFLVYLFPAREVYVELIK